MSINTVTIAGNLTRDVELRRTAGGTTVANFTVAVNESRKNQQTGEWDNYPNFIDCAMFGSMAERLEPMMHKGMKVCVNGKLHQDRWEKDGQNRSNVKVIVSAVELPPKASQKPQQATPPVIDESSSVYDDDIPF